MERNDLFHLLGTNIHQKWMLGPRGQKNLIGHYVFIFLKSKLFFFHPTCGYPATKNTDFVKWCRWINLGNAANMSNSVLAKRGGSEKVIYWLPIFRKPCLAITDHDPPVSIYPKKVVHVAFWRFTMTALLALASEHGKNMISWLEIRDTFTHSLQYYIEEIKQMKICSDK